jgi:hypothetical protein
MNYNLIILFIIIILLFYFINNRIIVQKENYLTYYLPFYNVDSNLLNTFYKEHNYSKNYFKKKFDYQVVKFGSSSYFFEFNLLLSKLIVDGTKSYSISSINYNNEKNIVFDLYNNKINLAIITIPLLNYFNLKYNINLDNLFLLSKLYKVYLIILTKTKYQIFNIDKIPYKTKIGVLNESNTIYFYINNFLKDLKYNKNDIEISFYKNLDDLYDAFTKDKIKIIIYADKLPNDNLNKLIDFNFERDIILLPFKINRKLEEAFLIKNSFLNLDTFDLNKITQTYLPKKFNKYYYFMYKPDFSILSLNTYLITNNKISDSNIDNITTLFLKNIKVINNMLENYQYKITDIGPSVNINKYLKYHPATLRNFAKFGYITNVNNDNCQFLTGVKECTQKTLEDNGLEIE